jgi:histidinol-phosphate aminotransferase
MTKRFTDAFSRREFLRWSAGAVGTAGLLGPLLLTPPRGEAFPPDPLFKGVVRMVYHENPWGPHPAAVEAIREAMGSPLAYGGINRYPDFGQNALKEAVLRYNGLEGVLTPENVVLGLGSAELLFMAADAFSSPETPFLTEWVTYRIILQRAEQNGAEIVYVPLKENRDADLETMYRSVKSAGEAGRPYGLVHFNVINNPAGSYLDRDTFRAFADRVYALGLDTIILCDDSDREFMDPALQPRLFNAALDVAAGKNMLHIQTFSHIFGLTGLRVGYGLARRDIVEKLEAHRIFSNMNVLGQAAAMASVEHAGEQIRRCNAACMSSREHLYSELDAMGLEYYRSQGHYNLINMREMDGTVAVLLMYLFKKVFVRWGFEWELDNWIRVNPSNEYENGRFIQALNWVLGRKEARGVSAAEYLSGTEGRRQARAAVKAGFPGHILDRAARSLRKKRT